jgi:hypothetical protein
MEIHSWRGELRGCNRSRSVIDLRPKYYLAFSFLEDLMYLNHSLRRPGVEKVAFDLHWPTKRKRESDTHKAFAENARVRISRVILEPVHRVSPPINDQEYRRCSSIADFQTHREAAASIEEEYDHAIPLKQDG